MENSKTTTPKTFCFVLMPFSGEFDDIYKIGIKEACDKAGAYCERVDEQIFSESILDRVYNQIAKADIVIADMTGRNPNVFYEVGYAHALGKLTILLTQNADDIPFDLKHFPHIVYGSKVSVLRDELEKRVKYFIDNPPTKVSDTKIGLDLFLGGENLASGNVVCKYPASGVVTLNITIHNTSAITFSSSDFKIGILAKMRRHINPTTIDSPQHQIESIELPDGRNLFMLPDLPNLFPNGYASRFIRLVMINDSNPILHIRLFTVIGSRDFPVKLIYDEDFRG